LGSDTDSQSKNCEAKQTYKDVSENYKAIRLPSKNRSKKEAREILLFKKRTKGSICKVVLVSHIFPFNRIFFLQRKAQLTLFACSINSTNVTRLW